MLGCKGLTKRTSKWQSEGFFNLLQLNKKIYNMQHATMVLCDQNDELTFLSRTVPCKRRRTYWNCDKETLMSLSLRKVDQLFYSGLPGACGCGGAVLLTKAMSFSSFVSSALMALLTSESWFKQQVQTIILGEIFLASFLIQTRFPFVVNACPLFLSPFWRTGW